ncbi:MAG: isopentenyl transferase family protein, partial [Succinivibrio dextrinosolvens]|nr:isopentenyl transferase family protein [Succinivibrio dextrinosolvens]
MKNKALVILGPTASGKTSLALNLARYLKIEIISLDSALIYKGMDIGTAKPTKAELNSVPHHLIDICDPSQSYSAANFREDCIRLVDEISARGALPVICGGTMMYY